MTAHPRLALNQATVKRLTLEATVEVCVAAGIGGIGLWRDRLAECGAARAGAIITDAGLTVTSLCRGGFLTAADPIERRAAFDDNRRAIDEARSVGAPVLILVGGGLPAGDRDLAAARARLADGIAELAQHAQLAGVRLAVEPLHPMFCADRCVVSTLEQALAIVAPLPIDVAGVCVDTYHVWWDPNLPAVLRAMSERIAIFQVADWVVPLAVDALLSRGHLGSGTIDLAAISTAVYDTGYDGWTEVELFRQDIWDADGLDTAREVVSSFERSLAVAVPR